MHKGDRVLAFAEVSTIYISKKSIEYITKEGWTVIHWPKQDEYSESTKVLIRRRITPAFPGIVIGYTRKATGNFHATTYYGPEEEPSYLAQDKRHLVVVVEPLGDNQYRKPWLCLEEDLSEL